VATGALLLLVLPLAAGLAHWGLRRVGRRLPLLLARRGGLAPGTLGRWRRRVAVALLPLKAALWLGVAYAVSERLPALHAARDALARLAATGATARTLTLGGQGYSILDLLALPLLLAGLWLAVGGVARLLGSQVLRSAGVERGTRETFAILVRYLLAVPGAIVVLQLWGIDVRSLALLAGVLGVGIGFGLQHIANNFVSGLLIGLERPIKPGDLVNVGSFTGTVERIGARSTAIRTPDRVTILVPNSRFIESEVVNWSHDPVTRLHIPVAVAYGSDAARVRAALLEAARGHSEVMADPRPEVRLLRFGESGIDFELLAWIRDPNEQARVTSELNFRVEAALRRHGLEIPFPQRDLRLRSPALEGLLAAWSRRHFSEAELVPSLGAAGTASLPAAANGANGAGDGLCAGVWDDAALAALAARMRGAGGVAIADRRHLLAVYPRCFVGREAVEWMVRVAGLARDEALRVGQLLVERDLLHHVLDEHPFRDAHLFYRFRADDPA
jgi:potassium efflux system protein